MCLVSWPAQIKADPTPRQQYIHAVDVVPTIYDLLGIEPPEVIKGYLQSPIEGESFAKALTDATVPGRETQFYTMLGQRSIYHQGWLACTVHPPLSGWGAFEKDEWELFHLETDRAQTTNVAADDPERLESLKQLWFYYAGIYNGLPLDDRSALEQVLAERPHGAPDRPRYEYFPDCADVPESAGVAINGRSYTIAAGVELDSADAEGVLYAHGGVAGGHSLYVKDKRLKYVFNWVGTHLQTIEADRDISAGRHVLAVDFAVQGPNTDPKHARLRRHRDALHRRRARRLRRHRHPARQLLPHRRRHLRRTRQRLAGHARLRRPRHVRVHRRHDRQGRRRRHRREVRRPRSTSTRLAADRLTNAARLVTYREFFSHVVDVVEAVGATILVVGGLGAFARYGFETRRPARSRRLRGPAQEPRPSHPARPRSAHHRRHHPHDRGRPVRRERRGPGDHRADSSGPELLARGRDRRHVAVEPMAPTTRQVGARRVVSTSLTPRTQRE